MSGFTETKRNASAANAPSVPLLIGAEPVTTGHWLDVMDPAAPRELVGRVALATEELSRSAIRAAEAASASWAQLEPEARAEALIKALDALEAERDANTELLSRENGKIVKEANIDLAVFIGRCRVAADLAPRLSNTERLPYPGGDGSRPKGAPAFKTEISHLPLGVVTIIVPFNWPLAILSASLPYALVAGNAVIVKPPPTAPLAVSRVLQALASKLPPGLVNVVSGTNEAVAPLITDPRIGRLVFTGSTAAGRKMMQLASTHLTPITLELGGNDPAIVLEDATLDRPMLERMSLACFLTSGQVCMAIKRIYVPASRYDDLVDGLSELLSEQKVGRGLAADSTMGPLNSARQRDFVRSLCAEARAAGHEVRELGHLAEESLEAGGHFLKPALVLNPSPELRIVTQEQFGPALPILKYADESAVIAQVNSEWAGLGSSVWSADLERAGAVADRIRAGSTWINNASATAIDDRAPFGGFRQSGIGREMGFSGLLEFTEAHTVTFPG